MEDLKKRILIYENYNTPPSLQRRYPKRESSNNKIGAPIGHKGTTRKTPEPNRFKELKLAKCPDCNKRLGRPRHIKRKIIEDIPDLLPLKITQFTIPHYFCNNCNKEVIPTDPELPDEGRFGPNLQSEITLMKYEDRLPHRKISDNLNRRYGLELTPASILDITRRVSDNLQPIFNAIKQEVISSAQTNADETGIKVQGNNFWTWVFVTLSSVLFLIRKSRGYKTLEEALGNNYEGIITCDGLKSYPKCTNKIQRCWAHLLREAKYYAQQYKGAAVLVYEGLCRIFKKIKKITLNTSNRIRKETYDWSMNEMIIWISICKACNKLKKFAVTIENGLEHWFTCILHPEIEPTNNKAENALREIVVQRKISSLWNEKGIRIKETVMSVLATWKLRGLNTFRMLRQTLSS
ncbi:MAG: IS66 family transposase [Candidatus Woesearchaeota archaeon]